jgi:hypothetical protein
MQTESNGENGKFLQYSEFQGQVDLSPLLHHKQLGYFGGGFESFDLLYPSPFVTLENPEAHCY